MIYSKVNIGCMRILYYVRAKNNIYAVIINYQGQNSESTKGSVRQQYC